MKNWVLSSNPTTTYRMNDWFCDGHDKVDWVSRNNFQVGDIVYIYEVLPKNGRGGIVCKTVVVSTGLSLSNKFEDEEYWIGGVYPSYVMSDTEFDRLRLTEEPIGGVIPFQDLKDRGFTAPQIGAHMLDKNPELLRFIQEQF